MENKQIDILDIIYYILKHKKFVFITTVIVSITAIIYSLVVPLTWTSTATFMTLEYERNSFSLSSSSLFGLNSSLLGSGTNENQNLIAIMKSRNFSEDIIRKFNLIELLKIDFNDSLLSMEETVRKLNNEITIIDFNEETGIISILVTTKDKILSAEMANYYIERLEEYNLKTRKTKRRQTRIFLEKRLEEEKSSIDSQSVALMQFNKDHHTISINEQTNALISHYSDLVARKISSEIELELALRSYGLKSPIINTLEGKIGILQNKIDDLENPTSSGGTDYLLNLDSIPELKMQYSNLVLQLEIDSKVYKYLYSEYESAKIEEMKDLPSLEIIDNAIPAGKRTSPRRARICIFSFLIAFILSAGSMIILELIKQMSKDKNHVDKITQIMKTFKK